MIKYSKAFTLTELLIALAILGLIAAFTLPKVMNGIQANALETKLKVAITALDGVCAEAYSQGVRDGFGVTDLLKERLNFTVLENPCTLGGSGTCGLLPDGTLLWRIDGFNGMYGRKGVTIDANGATLPNQEGVDRITLNCCLNTATQYCGIERYLGTFKPKHDGEAWLWTFYRKLFS